MANHLKSFYMGVWIFPEIRQKEIIQATLVADLFVATLVADLFVATLVTDLFVAEVIFQMISSRHSGGLFGHKSDSGS